MEQKSTQNGFELLNANVQFEADPDSPEHGRFIIKDEQGKTFMSVRVNVNDVHMNAH